MSAGNWTMPSMLVTYDGEKIETTSLRGRVRGLAWDSRGLMLTAVGNRGRALRIQDGQVIGILETGVTSNLRAVSVNPKDSGALAVGNGGLILLIEADGSCRRLNSPTSRNLRAVRWNADGSVALVAGNNGMLIRYRNEEFEMLNGGRANLRGISWRHAKSEALITSNCFAEEFIPSPNLFQFDAGGNTLKPLNETASDLIGVDWNPIEDFALAVGYDVVWHNGVIARFDDAGFFPIEFENHHVYPTTVSWDPEGHVAAVATSTTQPHMSQGRIMLWDKHSFHELYRNENFFFSNITWSPVGFKFAAVASTKTRTFDS